MSENWQFRLLADCLRKIQHMCCRPFVAILYCCSLILIRGFNNKVLPSVNDFWFQNYIMLLQHLASESLLLICSMDSKCKEDSARLLGCLIRSCARLILPYIAPIHKVSKKWDQCYCFLYDSYFPNAFPFRR